MQAIKAIFVSFNDAKYENSFIPNFCYGSVDIM